MTATPTTFGEDLDEEALEPVETEEFTIADRVEENLDSVETVASKEFGELVAEVLPASHTKPRDKALSRSKGSKPPRRISTAARVIRQKELYPEETVRAAAAELGRTYGARGGKARAESLSKQRLSEIGRAGVTRTNEVKGRREHFMRIARENLHLRYRAIVQLIRETPVDQLHTLRQIVPELVETKTTKNPSKLRKSRKK